jgi:hypothetical protein
MVGGRTVMLAAVPSDTVKDLVLQGKMRRAMELYRQEGATDQDVNYLKKANRVAVYRGISLEEALDDILKGPPAPASDGVGAARVGFGTVLLFVTCWVLGIGVLWIDLIIGEVLQTSTTPCTSIHAVPEFCGGQWTVGEVLFLIGVAALGIGLLVLPFLLRRASRRAQQGWVGDDRRSIVSSCHLQFTTPLPETVCIYP